MGVLVSVEQPQLTGVGEGDLKLTIQRVWVSIQHAFNTLQRKSPITDGTLVQNVPLYPNTDIVVQHGLGRSINGWIVVRHKVNALLWESAAKNALPRSTLLLSHNATAQATVDLWVF
jgi:hypothetical protein